MNKSKIKKRRKIKKNTSRRNLKKLNVLKSFRRHNIKIRKIKMNYASWKNDKISKKPYK